MKILPTLCCASMIVATAGIALAQAATPPIKIGVINAEAALEGTKEGQAAAAELQKVVAPKKAELDKQQAEIRDLQDKMQRNANTYSPQVLSDMKNQIDSKTKTFNRNLEDAQADAENQQRKLLDGLTTKMRQVIDKYGSENGYTLIIDVSNPNSGLAYASNAIDITQPIIALYDKMEASAPAARPAASPSRPAAPKAPTAAPPKK